MNRREFLRKSAFGSALVALPWPTRLFGNQKAYPVDEGGMPVFPKSLETDHQAKAKAAMVTNSRLRWLILRWQVKETPGVDYVQKIWTDEILPMLRLEPEYFVAIRDYYDLDTSDGWVRREIKKDRKGEESWKSWDGNHGT